VAGSYPALYLSSFNPVSVLRKQKQHGFGASLIRKGLVVFQFSISIILIISTLILYQQLNYISNKKLGFNPEQVIALRVKGIQPSTSIETLEKEIQQYPAVLSTSLAQTYPGHGASGRNLSQKGASEEASADLSTCRANPEIFDVLDIKILAGRPMKVREEEDSISQIVLNKSAVEFLGMTPEEAIGQQVDADLGTSEIVGVVEDFHFGSLHDEIGFYAFHNHNTEWLQYLLVKLKTNDLMNSIQQLKGIFEKVAPTTAFEYTFIDDTLEKLYRTEKRLAKVVFLFAGLAILIACLGLFALAAFATERRRKEIGVRKVLGASSGNIVRLLSKEFLQLVAIAFVIASPIAWYAMSQWLQDFSYRIDIPIWVFLVAGLAAVAIAFITVSSQSLKAALGNPIGALKHE
jgi:putative ABC transport system permease protein